MTQIDNEINKEKYEWLCDTKLLSKRPAENVLLGHFKTLYRVRNSQLEPDDPGKAVPILRLVSSFSKVKLNKIKEKQLNVLIKKTSLPPKI
ncbi:hypothetical protein QQG55_16235 [Brugia pahangi]